MPASAPARKLLLSLHVLASVGWAGALAVFLAHALAALSTDDPRAAGALALAMAITAWLVILPLAIASFATGVAQALLSAWGLARHHWVVLKLALTAVATAVLFMKLGPIGALAQGWAASQAGMEGLWTSLALHAAGGLAILVAATLLAIYKPAGLTAYGARRLRRVDAATPAWAKAGWTAAAALGLVLVAMLLLGNHGPSAHLHV